MSSSTNKLLYSTSFIFMTLLLPQIVQSANGMGDAAALGKIGYIIIIVGISLGFLMIFLLRKFQLSWIMPILICSILGFVYSGWFHLGSFAFITFYVWKIYQKKNVSSLVTILNESEKSDVVSEIEELAFSLTLPFEAFLQMDIPRKALSKDGQVTVYNINVESIDPTHGVLANCSSGQDDFSIPVIFLIPVDKTSENSVLIRSYTQNRMSK